MKKGFTLIELLVVIAILAILATVVVIVLNPAELLREGRDSSRLTDMAALHSALSLYITDVTTPQLAGASVCGTGTAGLASCTFATGTTVFETAYTINNGCGAGTASNTTVVGTGGWVPVNFASLSTGSPLATLPIDPTQNAQHFYAYACQGNNYLLEALMESVKFSNGGSGDVESTDPGDKPNAYEVGTNYDL